MRDADIDALLTYEETRLDTIKMDYDEALATKQVPNKLRIEVKNAMENLRSCLDYMAQDLSLTRASETKLSGNNRKHKVYFPYGKDKDQFSQAIKRNLPGIQRTDPLYHIIKCSLTRAARLGSQTCAP